MINSLVSEKNKLRLQICLLPNWTVVAIHKEPKYYLTSGLGYLLAKEMSMPNYTQKMHDRRKWNRHRIMTKVGIT